MIYSINTSMLGLSKYNGLSSTELVAHAGALYGVGPGGLEEFSGSDDNGAAIAWKLETGLAEHGSQRDKGFAQCLSSNYMSCSACDE